MIFPIPGGKNIGSHHLPRYNRYRVIAGRVIRGGGGHCTWQEFMECTRLDTKLAVAGAVRSGEFKAFELSSATETITSSFLWWLHAFFVPLHHFRDCIAVLLNTNFTQRYESKNRDTYKLHKSCDVSTLCQGFRHAN